ncbi:MAG: cytochrome c3 family protein [Desulfocapsaceae bacterium]|nr:cytochrome c3 family protein [Desulfocapsaceae bacterium]
MNQYILQTALAIILFCTIDCLAEPGISVQFPPDNSFVENKEISIVLHLGNEAIDSIRVVTGENKSKEISIRPGSTNTCFGLTLNKGMNTIKLLGLKQGKVVDQKEVNIFFRSALFPKFRDPPADFNRYFFHFINNEKSCAGCHHMEPTLSSLRPGKPEESPCYDCHAKKFIDNTFMHNPAAQGTCFACHEVLQGERKYTTPKPDDKVCFPCHNSQVKEWKSKKLMHGPTAVGQCTLCHNPHGSKWPALLRMQTTDLCINCHEDKASGTHVIAGFFGKGHPVRGVKNPLKPDQEFTCAGCHNPHAGNTQNLLNHDNSNMAVYCNHCHKK